MANGRTTLHAWTETRDYVRARRATLPPRSGRPSPFIVALMWLPLAIAVFLGQPPMSLGDALIVLGGTLAIALLVAALAAWADYNPRQTIILDRRRLYLHGTNHELEELRHVVVASRAIGTQMFPVLLLQFRNGLQRVVGRDDQCASGEALAATFRELGVKVED